MKSSKIVVKPLEITTRKPCPDRLVEYHIEPLAGNKKTAELRQPMANADILSNPEHLLRNPDLITLSFQRSLLLPGALKLLQPVRF